EQRVAVVEQELEEDAHAPGPLDRAEEEIDDPSAVLGRELRPDEGLRHQQDRFVEAALRLDQRANQIFLERFAFARGATEAGRAPQEEQRGEPLRHDVAERLLFRDLALEAQTSLAATEGLE